MTEGLADVFRYALESTRVEWVKFEDEMHFIECYLEIEKARFEERLAYSLDIDEPVLSSKIPPMILQPLVENAIKHGIGPKIGGGEIRVSGRLAAERLTIVVEDTGSTEHVASRQRGTGIGLANIRERLQHLYGDAAAIQLEQNGLGGTRAVLTLPQLTGVPL